MAAGVAAVVDHDTGRWLPLHLFLLGSVVGAIAAVAPLLAVTWSTSTPPRSAAVWSQRTLLTVGVVGLAAARELDAATGWLAAGGMAVVMSLVVLGTMLVGIRRRAQLDRFHPAIDAYLLAVGAGLVGSGFGLALAITTGPVDRALREAHLTVNLLGLVGIVVLATLPYLATTQLRVRRPARATARRLRATTAAATAAVALAATGLLTQHPGLIGAGYLLYAATIVATALLCPWPGRRQLRWAGPRVPSVMAGMAWWLIGVVGLGLALGAGDPPPARLVVVLIVGGYGQILAGSLAYLGPVVRGGGQERLTAGFASTRAPISVVTANVAVVGIVAEQATVVAAGVTVWLIELSVRALLLGRSGPADPTSPTPPGPTRGR